MRREEEGDDRDVLVAARVLVATYLLRPNTPGVGHRRSKPRSVERPPEGGHHTHHCTLRPDPRRRQTRAARAVSVNRQSAGTSPSRLALSAEVPGDFPQSGFDERRHPERIRGSPCVAPNVRVSAVPHLLCVASPVKEPLCCDVNLLGAGSSGHEQRDVVAVEQNLIELRDALALRRDLVLGHVLEHHVDVVIEAAQRADQLLVAAHNDVYL